MQPFPQGEIALDEAARLTPASARAWRARLALRDPGLPAALANPASWLGDFDALGPATRAAIVAQIVADTRTQLRGVSLGRGHEALARWLWRLREQAKDGHPRRAALYAWLSRFVWIRPRRLSRRLHALAQNIRARFARRPTLAAALIAAGSSPQVLCNGWARGVPADPRIRAFAHDPARRISQGYVVGLDLVPTPAGWFCVEANLEPGLRRDDPGMPTSLELAEGIAGFAAERGMTQLVMVCADLTRFKPRLVEHLGAQAARLGLQVTVVEDPLLTPDGRSAPNTRFTRWEFATGAWPDRTLVCTLRSRDLGSDRLVHDKFALARGLELYLRATGDTSFRIDPLVADPPVDEPVSDAPVPNIVYKHAGYDKGEGVFFLRARSADHARACAAEIDRKYGRRRGGFQRYLHGVPVPSGGVYHVRADVLITPDGAAFLGAVRQESPKPPPPVDWGIADTRHFSTNLSLGNRLAALTDDERDDARRAALGIASGIAWVIQRSFVTGPVGGDEA